MKMYAGFCYLKVLRDVPFLESVRAFRPETLNISHFRRRVGTPPVEYATGRVFPPTGKLSKAKV